MSTFATLSMCFSIFVFGWVSCDLFDKILTHLLMRRMMRDRLKLQELMRADVKQGIEGLEDGKEQQ